MGSCYSEDARALAAMLNETAKQAEGQDDPLPWIAETYPAMVRQIGKILYHLGQVTLVGLHSKP